MTEQVQEGITSDGVYTVTEKMLQKIELQEGVLLDELRSRPAPPADERYTGACAMQMDYKCSDYADFIESVCDKLDPDDEDPVCPIKCDHRVNPNPRPTPSADAPIDLFDGVVCDECEDRFMGCKLYLPCLTKILQQHDAAIRKETLDEFMAAIENRFDDTNNGRGVVGVIRGIKESLRQPELHREGEPR